MKKIITTLGCVVMASLVHAATFNWSVSTTTQSFDGYNAPTAGTLWSGATATAGMQYFLINAATYDQDELMSAMRNGTDWSSAVLASGTTGTDAKVAKTTFTTTDTESLSAYLILLNDDYAYLGSTLTKTGDTQGGTVDFTPAITTSKRLVSSDTSASYSNAGWYNVAAVPEPTSGLLLLLGVAGLALRRRRA